MAEGEERDEGPEDARTPPEAVTPPDAITPLEAVAPPGGTGQAGNDIEAEAGAPVATSAAGAAEPLRHADILTTLRFADHKLKFLLDDPLDEVQRYILDGVFYELDQLAYHQSLIPRSGRILDVGANVGNHTVYYSAVCQAESVIAVEPSPRASRLLRETVALNRLSGVDVVSGVALGGGESWGVLDETELLFHNLGGASVRSAEPGAAGAFPIRTGDAVVAGRPLDFIKIDVEGGEIQVLAGLQGTFDSQRPVLAIEIMAPNRLDFMAWCRTNSYRVERTFHMYRSILNFICIPA